MAAIYGGIEISMSTEEAQKTLEWAIQQLTLCQKTNYYGKITFIFENGKIVRRTSENSEVPPKIEGKS